MSITTREDKEHASKFAAVVKQSTSEPAAEVPHRRRRRGVPRWLMVASVSIVVAILIATTVGSRLLNDTSARGNFLTEKLKANITQALKSD